MTAITLLQRLKALAPTIIEICRTSGTPGVSLGVLHQGEVVYVDNFGYRNLEKRIAADEHTLYYIASLTKGFTAALIATLVDQGKLDWNTPVSTLLPEFEHFDETVRTKAGIEDFLSHRSGLASKNQLWLSEFGRLSMPRSETLRFASYLEAVHPFQKRWLYNNWGYGLADEITEKLTGQSWSECLEERIFKPLGMRDTTTHHEPQTDNYAEAYMAQADGSPKHVPRPKLEEGSLNEGAAAMQSSVSDLLIYYAHFMKVLQEQSRGETSQSPLRLVPELVRARVGLDAEPSETERSYALGWIRTQLPGRLGEVGLNTGYLRDMPLVGRGMQDKRMCLYHHGSMMSFLSAVHLLPDTQSGVVVLTNSMANNDAADWISQLILETLIEAPHPNDYLDLAAQSVKSQVGRWAQMSRDLESRRKRDTKARPLDQYVGTYTNAVGNWHIDIFEDQNSLKMSLQGNRKQLYSLDHYHDDTFCWLLDRNSDVNHGRFPVLWADFYLMAFKASEDGGGIDGLLWKHDPDVPTGELFAKDDLY